MGIEVQVHQQLLALLRHEHPPTWPHQLTMGRLVARALQQGRSTLAQVSGSGEHRLSYLLPALSSTQPVIICANAAVQQQLLEVDLPLLRKHVHFDKAIGGGDRWPGPEWQGVLVTDPKTFLTDRLRGGEAFPEGVAVVIDGAHELEAWALAVLSDRIEPADWDALRQIWPDRGEVLLDWRIRLTRTLLGQTQDRLTVPDEQARTLQALLMGADAEIWTRFRDQLADCDRVNWAEYYRESNQFSLISAPIEVNTVLQERLWSRQPVVVIGEALDPDRQATLYRQRLGLPDMTCLRFPPDPREQEVLLYLPSALPDPTAPLYQQQLEPLLTQLIAISSGPLVILMPEGPLRASLGAHLAAQLGSRVSINRARLHPNGVVLCSWEFWETYHHQMSAPTTLAICTLPFPSLDDPLVAARVQWLKNRRRDWFRTYLLPETMGRLQRGISPLRYTQGLVALLDSRVNSRSYGTQLLDSLTPARRVRYLEGL